MRPKTAHERNCRSILIKISLMTRKESKFLAQQITIFKSSMMELQLLLSLNQHFLVTLGYKRHKRDFQAMTVFLF
jgi:hypothetical protein